MNALESLKTMTTVVADTGNFETVSQYKPTDATTNPSLIYQASQMDEYKPLLMEALSFGKQYGHSPENALCLAQEKVAVNFGHAILQIVPGRVSTEIDARLSFDKNGTIEKAHHLVDLYEQMGVDRKRVLLKIAATWEGIQAAAELEKDNIRCNLTLVFSFIQAAACANAGVFLISPFVGRILDWYRHNEHKESYSPQEDPGVIALKRIYNYYKYHDFKTVIMGASFRNRYEIEELAGCDLLTISPTLLDELSKNNKELLRKLSPDTAQKDCSDPIISTDEKTFRWMLNQDSMATEKLAGGIRNFTRDTQYLEDYLKSLS